MNRYARFKELNQDPLEELLAYARTLKGLTIPEPDRGNKELVIGHILDFEEGRKPESNVRTYDMPDIRKLFRDKWNIVLDVLALLAFLAGGVWMYVGAIVLIVDFVRMLRVSRAVRKTNLTELAYWVGAASTGTFAGVAFAIAALALADNTFRVLAILVAVLLIIVDVKVEKDKSKLPVQPKPVKKAEVSRKTA